MGNGLSSIFAECFVLCVKRHASGTCGIAVPRGRRVHNPTSASRIINIIIVPNVFFNMGYLCLLFSCPVCRGRHINGSRHHYRNA